jgi:hypothetical protein
MDIQYFDSGKTRVVYGDPVEYQSPILVDENYPTVVTYKCAVTLHHIGKVYQTQDGRWWLATCFWNHWMPVEVFSKIEGFFLLNNLHKQNERHHEH